MYYETQQQNPMANPQFNPQQWSSFGSQFWQGPGNGIGQAAYGQQFGAQPSFGGPGYNPGWVLSHIGGDNHNVSSRKTRSVR